MFYSFPEDLSIAEVRRVIAKHNERLGATGFAESVQDGYSSFNYIVAFADSFPQPDNEDPALAREYAILRECRGLIMDHRTGEVLARRYHKFFNVDEKEFTQSHRIDWGSEHIILEKLDGSMISPFRCSGEHQVRWGTKRGETAVSRPVAEFVQENPKYEAFAASLLNKKVTPIFEWCSPQQRIVINYQSDNLILTGIRENSTGRYWSYDAMKDAANDYDIPIVGVLPGMVKETTKFLEQMRQERGIEGVIIRFRNGHMVKIKTEEYCLKHRAIDLLHLEKNVWQLVLSDDIDDFIATLPENEREALERFQNDLNKEIILEGQRYERIVERARRVCRDDKKKFATGWIKENGKSLDPQMLFSVWDGSRGYDVLRKVLMKNVGSASKIESVRPFVNFISWADYRSPQID